MSPVALALVLVAALTHATWNFAAKRAGGGALFLMLCSLVALPLFALPVTFALVHSGLPRGEHAWGALLASAILHIAYSSVLQRAYREADLSVVYPVARGTGPLLTLLLAVVLLGERPRPLAVCGALVVVAGVFLLAGGRALLSTRDRRARLGTAWGAATGVLIASYTVVDAYAVRTVGLAPLVLDYVSHLTRVSLFAPLALRDVGALAAEWRRTRKQVLIIALLGPLGYILVLTALQYAPVTYVAPARELSMLIGAFLGARVLDEGSALRRIACASLIALGVAMIALSG